MIGMNGCTRTGTTRLSVLAQRVLEEMAGHFGLRLPVSLREERAQGTTEYAILVGVLVVIAILAIIAFRDRVSELWEAISSGINSL